MIGKYNAPFDLLYFVEYTYPYEIGITNVVHGHAPVQAPPLSFNGMNKCFTLHIMEPALWVTFQLREPHFTSFHIIFLINAH